MGSKSRIAKYLVPIIQGYLDKHEYSFYLEPFCGGCNIIDKIDHPRRLASDKQHYLIELFKNTHKLEELPKDFVTREHYNDVRNSYNTKDGKYEDWYIGAIGFLASYNGRFFDGGYAGTSEEKGKVRNYYDETFRNLKEQVPNLLGIMFFEQDYSVWDGIENCLIYCDPPYKGTKQYNVSKNFDYDKFWNWCREMSKKNTVLISEESAPDDFECIWEQPVMRTIKANDKKTKVEKLFKQKESNNG
jgi:DNA adenine methylase